jgi:BirA family transcriptional regulator, biotin operon repressor / biotin---[acetyl-CoA-carboxylase] ligase
MKNYNFIKQTHSTNILLWEMFREKPLPEGMAVYTDFQTSGRGQIGNSWESEAGKNLLVSMILYPNQIPIDQIFLVSQLVSVAIKQVLEQYCDNISIKWANDIYWKDKKLAGILIENSLQGNKVKAVVIGIGLNVNQLRFLSDAPNPVSLKQITGKSLNRKQLLDKLCQNIWNLYCNLSEEKIRCDYAGSLYRKKGFHAYKTHDETFIAKINEVHPDGLLELETKSGERKGFYFKEVQFI